MNEFLDIEKILNAVDFSQGHEEAVWEKIAAGQRQDAGATPSGEFDDIAGIAGGCRVCQSTGMLRKNPWKINE